MNASKTPLAERIAHAEAEACRLLGNANEALERGNRRQAERLERAGEKWLTRANDLRGWGDVRPPKR